MMKSNGIVIRSLLNLSFFAAILGFGPRPAAAQEPGTEATPAQTTPAQSGPTDAPAQSAKPETTTGDNPTSAEDASTTDDSSADADEQAASQTTSQTVVPVEAAAPVAAEPIPPASTVPLDDTATVNDAAEPEPAPAPEPASTEKAQKPKGPRGPFSKGRIRVGVGVGWASSTNDDWLILGLSGGYYLFDGLEAGLDTSFWVVGSPFISTLSPQVRYVLHFVPKVKPYVGTFYRHYFVASGQPDSDSVGARFGAYIMTGATSYFGGGAVYEHFLDGDLYPVNRNQWYPEIVFAFSF